MPGRTHLQHAQPVLLSHHLLAHAWPLLRDCDRIVILTVGSRSARTARRPWPAPHSAWIPRPWRSSSDLHQRGQLHRRHLVTRSSGRGGLHLAQIAVDLSRLSEDVIIWVTQEFGFATLADEWSTGSSIMPQKKNPDVAELARARPDA